MPIKQSALVMLTLLGGMGYTAVPFAGFLFLSGWMTACLIRKNLILRICNYLRREEKERYGLPPFDGRRILPQGLDSLPFGRYDTDIAGKECADI